MTRPAPSCPTCADEAVAARVRAVEGPDALVDADGRVERVAIDLVPEVRPGELVLCHAGIALEILGRREKERIRSRGSSPCGKRQP